MNIKPFRLERYYTLYEHSAKYSICNSDCEAMTINELLALEKDAEDAFQNTWLGYTDTKGDLKLRDAISSKYNNLSAENIRVCTGAQEPIFLISHALLKVDDEVIVQTPCYQSLQSVPESIGCKVLSWNVRYQNNRPTFDLDELKKLINAKTKAIYLNAPHNPTGYLFTKKEQQEIIDLARANNIFILSDEVYRELEHHPEFKIPAFGDAYENGISIGVMSKSYGLPGLRIGWIATQNQDVLEQFDILKEYTTICNAAPSEYLAGVALRNSKTILGRNLQIVQNNLKLYETFFDKYADLFSWYKPNAGPITLVKMLFDNDDLTFADRLLKEKSVLILPGSIYDYPGYFRVGFGRKTIQEGLEQFEAFVLKNMINA